MVECPWSFTSHPTMLRKEYTKQRKSRPVSKK